MVFFISLSLMRMGNKTPTIEIRQDAQNEI